MTKINISGTSLKVLILVAVAILMVALRPVKVHTFPYHYAEGQIWQYDTLTADVDFSIYKSEQTLQQERKEALKNYAPCFQSIGEASSFFVLSYEDMERVRDGGYDHIAVVNRKHVATDVPVENIYTPKSAFLHLGKELEPTLAYDSLTSVRVYENILAQVSPTIGAVFKGEVIVEPNEIISHEDYLVIASYERFFNERGYSRPRVILMQLSRFLLVSLLIGLFGLYLWVFRRVLWQQTSAVLLFVLLLAMLAGSAMLLQQLRLGVFIYMLPFAWVPIIVRVFYDSRTAFMLHLVTVTLVSLAVPNPYLFLLLQLIAGLVVICSLKSLTKRSQLVITAVYVFAAYSVVYTLYMWLLSGNWQHVDWRAYVDFALNGVLIIMVYSLIFLFEKAFRLVSSVTLVELSNINSDLMQEFARVAPGTFQHSVQVSNLASEAAKIIGAKALLVRTAALYHDLGKMEHADFYTENQAEGQNPLLEMSNREAARAIISHVIQGESLARKHHLPEIIISFIRSHHGTSLTRYFYNAEINRLRESSLDENLIHIADFRYPGPKPTTKEGAILMMADAVEARSRSLTIYTEQSISEMVDAMITTQIEDGQFAETPLSFRDLELIRQSFKDRLLVIYHRRIQYPTVSSPSHNDNDNHNHNHNDNHNDND